MTNLPEPWKIKEYNVYEDFEALMEYMDQAAEDGMTNNDSLKALAWDRMRNQKGKVFLIYFNNEIAALSYTHDFTNYVPDTWRCISRASTLIKYRGIHRKGEHAIPGWPEGLTFCSGLGINVLTLPMQVDYAKTMGAKQFIFTTHCKEQSNTLDPAASVLDTSQNNTDIFEKVQGKDPRMHLLETKRVYGVDQHIWRYNFRDLINMKGQI